MFRYIDVKQLAIDAKVAASLCVGGPIKYKFKEGVNIADNWLFEHVVPNIRRRYPNDAKLCRVLGTALLFAAMDPQLVEMLPQGTKDRVTQAYLHTHPQVPQPVERIPLTVYRVEDTLCIDETPVHVVNEAANAAAGGGNGAAIGVAIGARAPQANRDQMNAVLVNLQRTQQGQSQMHMQLEASISSLRQWAGVQFKLINTNVRRFGGTIQGAMTRQDPEQAATRRRATAQETMQDDGLMPATLSSTPRTLAELWEEYQFGIGGRKPAKDFTRTESGNTVNGMKQKFYRRKFVWLTIELLIQRGDSRDTAIHKLRQVYGFQSSVTQIINYLIRDHANGGNGNPNLINLRPYLRGGAHFGSRGNRAA